MLPTGDEGTRWPRLAELIRWPLSGWVVWLVIAGLWFWEFRGGTLKTGGDFVVNRGAVLLGLPVVLIALAAPLVWDVAVRLRSPRHSHGG